MTDEPRPYVTCLNCGATFRPIGDGCPACGDTMWRDATDGDFPGSDVGDEGAER